MGEPKFRDAAPPGTQVGPLVLGEAMGQGSEGIAYRASHAELGDVVVREYWPKQIVTRARGLRAQPAQPGWQAEYRLGVERFQTLGERLQALPSHPGVVRVHETLVERNTVYLVMDPLPGRPLSVVLAEQGFSDPADVIKLADRMTATLAWLHGHGLFHCDIAPDTVLITPGPDWDPVLVDFGAARDMMRRISPSCEEVLRPGYTPTEQRDAEGAQAIGPWTDIFAAGAVLHCAITGGPPPEPGAGLRRPRQYRPLAKRSELAHPPALLGAIDRALAPRPDKRPSTVEAWRDEMGEALPSMAEQIRAVREAAAAEAEAQRLRARPPAVVEAPAVPDPVPTPVPEPVQPAGPADAMELTERVDEEPAAERETPDGRRLDDAGTAIRSESGFAAMAGRILLGALAVAGILFVLFVVLVMAVAWNRGAF